MSKEIKLPTSIKGYHEELAKLGIETKSKHKPYLKGRLTKALEGGTTKKVTKEKSNKDVPASDVSEKDERPILKKDLYQGYTNVKVLGSGHTPTHYHCSAKDGDTTVTVHVPRKLFV